MEKMRGTKDLSGDLPTYKSEHDEYYLELETLISTDLLPLKEGELRQLSKLIKLKSRTFCKISRNYSLNLIDSGIVHIAQEIRQMRSELFKDVKEMLLSINVLLCDLGFEKESTFDCNDSKHDEAMRCNCQVFNVGRNWSTCGCNYAHIYFALSSEEV